MSDYTIEILFDEHLKRFFYLQNGKPAGEMHCCHEDRVQWETQGNFAARVEFGEHTPLKVSGVDVPTHGPSAREDVVAKNDRFKYSVKLTATGEHDDPDLAIGPR